MQIVNHHQQRAIACHRLQHPRELLKQIVLLRIHQPKTAIGPALRCSDVLQPLCSSRRVCLGPRRQSAVRQERVDKIRTVLCQAFHGSRHHLPQSAGCLSRDRARSDPALNVAGQQLEDFAEWKVRIADSRVGAAIAGNGNQIRTGAGLQYLDE